MKQMNIEMMPIDSIRPYEKNAKKHPADQVEHIANSIREFGFRQPLVIDKDGVLIIGHGRLLAAKSLGMHDVPVVRADDLTEEQVKALRLADNKTNESDWDFGLLDAELDEIIDIDMTDFGFEDDYIGTENISEGEIEDNTEKKVAVKIIFKNAKEWQKAEDRIRDFIDDFDGVTVSVGEYDEN